PNVIATVVSTGVLSPCLAVVVAVLFSMLGAMAGTAVAATVGKGIVDPSAAAMLSIIAWGGNCSTVGHPGEQVTCSASWACWRWPRRRWLDSPPVGGMAEGWSWIDCLVGTWVCWRAPARQACHRIDRANATNAGASGFQPPSVSFGSVHGFQSWP